MHVDPARVSSESQPEELQVYLYGGKPAFEGTGAIGAQLKDLYLRFGVQPSTAAVDLVSVALAVTAADTFVLREDASNSWSRKLDVMLPLHSPDKWERVRPKLEVALNFLTGDMWHFEFSKGGEEPPAQLAIRNHKALVDLSKTDLVSLFSGGLDSTISTFELLANGRRPLLVSHAYQGDAGVQNEIKASLPTRVEAVSINAWPNSSLSSETTMRSRSFLFIAIATLVCDARSRFKGGSRTALLVPENGLIALNPPLTLRRLGALSTRTTHPHYLKLLQEILDEVQLNAQVTNPYEFTTKGEMVDRLSSDACFATLASKTVSCGKWHRSGQQCGHCVPCLIRRAALYAGNVDDATDYASPDLSNVMQNETERDDLVAMLSAVAQLNDNNVDLWAARSGPMPSDPQRRAKLVGVFQRGIAEVGAFLRDSGVMP